MTAYLQIKEVSVVFAFSDPIADVLEAVSAAILRGAVATAEASNGSAVIINFRQILSADVDAAYDTSALLSKTVWPTTVAAFFKDSV